MPVWQDWRGRMSCDQALNLSVTFEPGLSAEPAAFGNCCIDTNNSNRIDYDIQA